MVTNIPQTGNGYKLLGKEETVDKISPWVGRKGPTAADAPLFTAIGKPYKRKWVDSSEYDAYIRNTAAKYDVEPALVKAVIQVESNFDPDAVSRAGARGLMQLMPGTAAIFLVFFKATIFFYLPGNFLCYFSSKKICAILIPV